ncbi:dihydroorotate dehydrogenase electron transfer subunit [Eubacteriales bacterium OttesenSCG-928-M02]|nr:dihydroorotate dehydrogenase electron transfer subunit [Eubacteriales bacterium OttesenSCG-928-M02]
MGEKQGGKEYTVCWNEQVAENTYHMGIAMMPGMDVIPGQFVNIAIPNRPELILRRPISINGYEKETGVLEIIYQVVGKGTAQLSQVIKGEQLDVLGPLGRGFSPGAGEKDIWLVGGGIGVAPLQYLPAYYGNIRFTGIFGFRNKALIYREGVLREQLAGCRIVTDDGTNGEKGFVTDALREMLQEGVPDAIYICGPVAMIKAVKEVLADYPTIPAYVSMEERMGCGVGVCMVCTCLIEQDGEKNMRRVCVDGPVFAYHPNGPEYRYVVPRTGYAGQPCGSQRQIPSSQRYHGGCSQHRRLL